MNDYKVLARKYRPQTFRDLVGQEVLVRTLSNAIDSNRLAHAFVLTGIRGIGKTTTARIMAKALNCIGEDGTRTSPTIDPCGVCIHCTEIRDDRHIDVLELDAASNTGVDNARELIESSHYKPVSGRYKVYIIDEAHMLSNSSFNALLKTLEEPPANVVFIFATTELRKIPITILSRCQRFDLRRLKTEEMVEHLRKISANENISIEEEALDLVAIASEGSVRDGLSLLDQAISHSDKDEGGKFSVQAEILRKLLGLVDRTKIYDLLSDILSGEVERALGELQAYYEAGANMVQLIQDLMHGVHDVSRLIVIPNYRFDNSYSEAEKNCLREIAGKLSVSKADRAWQIMSKGIEEVRKSASALRAAEMLIIRLCYAANMPSPDELIKIISKGELKNNVSVQANNPTTQPNSPAMVLQFPSGEKQVAKINNFNDIIALCEAQKEMILLHNLKNNVRVVSCANGELVISDKSEFAREDILKLQALIATHCRENWRITAIAQQGDSTIAQQIQMQKTTELEDARNHHLVLVTMQHFEGAKLVKIQ